MRFSVSVHQEAALKMCPEALPTLGCPSPQILRGFLVVVYQARPSPAAHLGPGPPLGPGTPEPSEDHEEGAGGKAVWGEPVGGQQKIKG